MEGISTKLSKYVGLYAWIFAYESSQLPSYGLISTTTALLQEWLWHEITQEGWYGNKETEYLYILLTPLDWQDVTQGQFQMKFSRFEFRVFILLDQLPNEVWRGQSTLLFTHSWRENDYIHTISKVISAMWNANSLVQDLNSCRLIHLQRRYPLYNERLHICT